MEDATVLTQGTVPVPKTAERREVFASRARLLPTLKLTRAHLAANRHPLATEAMKAGARAVAERLGAQLQSTVSCEASLLSATLHPLSHIAARALFVTVDLQGEALALIELDALGVGALIAHITGAKEVAALPTRLSNIEEAALAWVLLTTLSELRKEPALAAWAPRLISMTLDRSEALATLDGRRRHLGVQLSLKLGAIASVARVIVPAQWAQTRLEGLSDEPGAALQHEVGEATLPGTCVIGTAMLPKADVATLAAGDVILFSNVTREETGLRGEGRLITPLFELRGQFSPEGLTLNHAHTRSTLESSMTAVDPALPVEVEIELTRLRVPVSQLGALRPGGLLPLHINATPQVVVRIGDKAVARAELVEIEGEIGARILSML